ncbi:MAG: hypothetical protein ABI759_24910 [Candidatus Solibacter sp.]
MRRIVCLFGILTASSVLAFADDFQGRLVDASCYSQQKSSTACDPSSASTSFILYVGDTAYSLDAPGNQKAAQALKTRADRTANPAAPASSQVMAKVKATKDAGDTLKVEAIDIQ